MIITKRRQVRMSVVVPQSQMHAGLTQDKVWQEFFCRTLRSQDAKKKGYQQKGCGGYIIVPLSIKFTGKVRLKCPKCQHVHTRYVEKGYLQENGRSGPGDTIDLTLMISAWSQEPRTKAFQKLASRRRTNPDESGDWDATVITGPDDLANDPAQKNEGRSFLLDSWWQKLFGSERDSKET